MTGNLFDQSQHESQAEVKWSLAGEGKCVQTENDKTFDFQ